MTTGGFPEEFDDAFLVRALVEDAPVGIAFVDLSYCFRRMNQTLAALNGRTPDAFLGKHVEEVMPRLWPELHPVLERVITSGRAVTGVELKALAPTIASGEGHWLCDYFPVRGTDGTIVGVGVLASDATERKRAEREIVRLAEHERAILEAMPDLIFELSRDGTHLSFHAPHASDLYAAPGQFIGKRIAAVLPAPVTRIYEGAIERALATGEMQVFEYELDFSPTDRRTFDARMVRKAEDDVLVVVRDVTARKALEEQFRQAQRMEAVGRLAGGVAHDFNNLLTVISGYTDILLQTASDDDTLDALMEVSKAAHRGANLTRQLLTFSRQQVIEPRVVNLNDVIADTERMLQRLVGEDIEHVTRLDETIGLVQVDPGQIEQVLVNLVVNARDAMRPGGGGTLTVETSNETVVDRPAFDGTPIRPGDYVVMAVADTGVGMEPDVRARMFEPFFSTKAAGTGTGLGLAVVFGVVKQSGGFIGVETTPGRGSIVKSYFPRVAGEAIQHASPADMSLLPAGTETLLLVEDDAAVRALADRILTSCGYVLTHTANGREALDVIASGAAFDLLITDVVMPQMGGPELAEAVRRLRPGVRVLFTSGYTPDEVLRRGVLSAEVSFLQKPFTASTLANKVRSTLDSRSDV
jgi:PAS domain S-box-containing protein